MAVVRLSLLFALVLVAASCGRNASARSPQPSHDDSACAPSGTFRERTLIVEGEARHYLLHVPSSYVCGVALPLLVDFHGTTSDDSPEEHLLLEEAIALADERGFILVRPRSRPGRDETGDVLYQWDVNEGDIDRNIAFTRRLVAAVRAEYDVDPDRLYAFGYSNGTNMASLFLGFRDSPFVGYAVVGGGAWAETQLAGPGDRAPRLYATTGHRDYMNEWHRELVHKWHAAGHSPDNLFARRSGGGHELYRWQYGEAWDWIDRGHRPDQGVLREGWEVLPTGTSHDLLAIEEGGAGLVIAGANGFLARQLAGGWVEPLLDLQLPYAVTDVCLRSDGTGVAVSEVRVAATTDFGVTWSVEAAPPEFYGDFLGASHLLGTACGPRFVAGGYWSGASTADPLRDWRGAAVLDEDGVPEHLSDFAFDEEGGVVAVGEFVIARSESPTLDTLSIVGESDGWLYGVARADSGRWWAVGAEGEIQTSHDDAWSWTRFELPGDRNDLYAVHFADEAHGVIVGARGSVFVTSDGGSSWSSIPTGLDHFLGDAIAQKDGSVIVVGEGGFMARWRPPQVGVVR